MLELYVPALVGGFLITIIELTEVVALVFALGTDRASLRPVTAGAVSGIAVVSLLALGFGAALGALPRADLLWAAAIALAGFGVFLFRSLWRSFRASRSGSPGRRRAPVVEFGGGFTVGAVESTEVVVVLLALAAAGYGVSALLGAVAGGVALAGAAAVVHERIRRIKVPWLKLAGSALLFSYAAFWAGEAAGVAWPGGDLVLIPFVVGIALAIRGLLEFAPASPAPAPA
jgi:Ca2+/H+ antiporter, TMEM165/GDT1 family